MNRQLRSRHRIMMIVLAPLCLLILVAGLLYRQSIPDVANLTRVLGEPEPALRELVVLEGIWGEPGLTTTILTADDGSLWLEFRPHRPILKPDVLIYWHAGEIPKEDAVPREAYFIGSLAGTEIRRAHLPELAKTTDGTLLLYSLGHQEVLDSALLSTSKLQTGGGTQ